MQGAQLYMDDCSRKSECRCIKEVIVIKWVIKFVQFCDNEMSFQSECDCTGFQKFAVSVFPLKWG